MKIKFTCSKCFVNGIATNDFVQIGNDDLYFYTCSKGHENVYFLKNEKFELLMESAIYAILDGYYREAVSAMTSSLERLQEFALKIFFRKNGLHDKPFEAAWKEVSRQSERQLGAFIFLYTIEYKSLPDSLTSKEREFRNDIIHKGKFPNYEETINYGQRVLDITFNILNTLRKSDEQIIRNLAEDKKEEMLRKFDDLKEPPFTHLSPTSINLHHDISSFEKTNLLEYIELLRNKDYS